MSASSNAAAAEIWERWRPEFVRAIEPDGHWTIESIERDIREERSRLWVDGEAAVLVEFLDYAGGAKACQVLKAAGDLNALIATLPKLEAAAREAGCTEMLIAGRAGWARLFEGRGYRPWSLTIRKEL